MADAADRKAGGKGQGDARYQARVLPTGLGRLEVLKVDPGRGLCLRLTLVHGATAPRLPVEATAPWHVEKVGAWLTSGDCDRASISPPTAWARTASGTIRLRPEGGRCLVDVDVTVAFDARPGLHATERLVANGVAFSGVEQPCRDGR